MHCPCRACTFMIQSTSTKVTLSGWTVLNHELTSPCMRVCDTKFLSQSLIVWMNHSESYADLTMHASLRRKVPKPKSHHMTESFWIMTFWPPSWWQAAVASQGVKAAELDLEEVPCRTEADRFARMVNDKALELVDRCDRTLFEHQWDVAGFVVKTGTLNFCFVFWIKKDH